MYVKELSLFGFKSFGRKTKIHFEDGITAVVGPNGCGKSNLVDAFRWITGEQRSKTLRGERMEDLIFSGTIDRKSLSIAEVSLVIENTNGILPLDLDEIKIVRRIHRSGEKEYLINDNPCRLKDISDFFLDTGVGKSAYSVMEQGRIDQILSTRPEDRRIILEEAAGITKFKARKKEAELKLVRTHENLNRIIDILAERQRQLEILKRQAERAKRYKELKKVLKDEDTKIILHRLQQYEKQMASTGKKNTKLIEQLQTLEEEEKELQQVITQSRTQIEQLLESIEQNQFQHAELDKRIFEAEVEKKHLMQNLAQKRENLAKDQGRIRNTTEEVRHLESIVKQHERDHELLNEELNDLSNQEQTIKSTMDNLDMQIAEHQEKMKNHKIRVKNMGNQVEALGFELRKAIDKFINQLDALSKEGEREYTHLTDQFQEIQTLTQTLQEENNWRYQTLNDVLDEHFFIQTGTNKVQRLKEVWNHFQTKQQSSQNQFHTLLQKLDQVITLIGKLTQILWEEEGEYKQKRDIDKKIQSMQEQIETYNEEIVFMENTINTLVEEKQKHGGLLTDIRVDMAQLSEKEKNLGSELNRQKQNLVQLAEQKERLEEQIEEMQDTILEMEQKEHELEQTLEILKKDRETQTDSIGGLKKQREKLERDIIHIESQIKLKQESINQVKANVERQHLLAKEVEVKYKSLVDFFIDQRGETPEALQDQYNLMDFNQQESETRKEEAREELTFLGQVNLLALDEYHEMLENVQYLESQKEDIDTAKDQLIQLIHDTEREASERFVSTLQKINNNFQDIFARLFNGGQANLFLADESNVLESGIHIHAQPPGKKLQSILLMSGGERSMTALALLFAIFMEKPSPFCLLDEVDAALDEENINRFIRLLKEFSEKTQFFIVTHNKVTVSAAEIIYGVTMEESGISKVLAIKVD